MRNRTPDPALYREAFGATTGANLITDTEFQTLDVTEDCLDMLDRDRDTLLEATPEQLFADGDVYATATERVAAGAEWSQEVEILTGDKQTRRMAASAAPLDDDGERRGAVFGFRDLTEQYNREESLRVLNRVLRHNLRNDANVVLGHLEDAKATAENEQIAESVEVARQRMQGSLERARTVRAFSRHLTTDEAATLYPVDLAGALKQALNKVDTADADLRVDVRSGLLVRADETVTAALRNVVENAVEHTGQSPRIAIDAVSEDGSVRLRVADDGPGIPPARRDEVRERGGSAVRHGQGLGFFFVDRLLAVYGGDLYIGDSDLSGCLVTLEFRRANSEGTAFEEG